MMTIASRFADLPCEVWRSKRDSRCDALQTLAFSILSDADMPEVRIATEFRWFLNWRAPAVLPDVRWSGIRFRRGRQTRTSGRVERIHRHKTGALIRAAVRLGH